MDVLIAVSDESFAARLRTVFEARGHKVTLRKSGRRTLEALEHWSYAVAALARGLSGLSGLDVVAELRRSGRHVPVVMLGSGSVSDLVECLNGGADDYVATDGMAPDELVARLEALGRRSYYPASSPRVEAAGILIEATREVTASGRPLDLTASELRVLTCLAVSMGRVVSRETLMTACYGERGTATANALESVVKRLRKKLGERHGARLKWVRSHGYVLVDRAD